MVIKSTERRAARPSAIGERQAPFTLRSAADDAPNDGWTLDGYAAVFNRMTVIDSWEGVFRETIANNSMKRSFRESPPIVQFDHGRHPLIGSWPIAELLSATEETDPVLAPEGGAHMVARMFEHLFFEPLRNAIAVQAVKGMSFRFEVLREMWQTYDGKKIKDDEQLMNELRKTWDGTVPEEELPIRTLQELKVPEMGPVVWPAYTETSIGVRSIDLDRLESDPEQRTALVRKLFIMPSLADGQAQSKDVTRSDPPEPPQVSTRPIPPTRSDPPASEPAGERPSNSRGRRGIDVSLRTIRDMLQDIQTREESK